MKLVLRAVNEYDESVCKPVSVTGEVVAGGAFGDRFMPKNRVVMHALESGTIHRICFVDPKTGQELPITFNWPGQSPYATYKGQAIPFNRTRLTIAWPPKEPVETKVEDAPVNIDSTVPVAWREIIADEPMTLAVEAAPVDVAMPLYLVPDGRIVNEEQLRAEGMVSAVAPIARAFFETMRTVGLPAYVMNDDGEIVPAPR